MTAIKTAALSKYYGSIKALDKLDLEVPDNVVFGFLGPNGAGKTTTVKLLTGFAHPTHGTAQVAGETVMSGNIKLQSKIGLLPDVPAFYDWMTGREFLQFVGELHHLPQKEIKKRSVELLETVDLKQAGNRRVGGYSSHRSESRSVGQ